MRGAILPERPARSPQRRQTFLMGNCILDDDGLDFLRLGNSHAHSNRSAIVVQVKRVATKIQRLSELPRNLSEMVEGVTELFRAWPGRMSEARKVWRDEAVLGAERGLQHRLIHSRRRWKAVKQKNDRADCRPGFAIKDVEAIHLDGFVRNAFLAESWKCVHKQCQTGDFADEIHAVSAMSGCFFARAPVIG